MKVFEDEIVTQAMQDTLQGTCTYADAESAVADALYGLLCDQKSKETKRHFLDLSKEERSTLEKESEKMAEEYINDGIEEKFYQDISGSGFGLCGCGWWCEDLYHSTSDGEDCCGDCAEEENED